MSVYFMVFINIVKSLGVFQDCLIKNFFLVFIGISVIQTVSGI